MLLTLSLSKLTKLVLLLETFDAIEMAKEAGYTAVVSHRSGETEDSTIADIAVANKRRTNQDWFTFTYRPYR